MTQAVPALDDLPRAIVAGDAAQIARCFHPDVRFRALTPNTERHATSADDAVAIIGDWFREKRDLLVEVNRTIAETLSRFATGLRAVNDASVKS